MEKEEFLFKKKKNADFKFDVGDKAKDTITGFVGIIVSRTQWLHNCNVYGLQPQELKDGKPIDRQHFDEPAIELIKEKAFKESRSTGGPERSVFITNRERGINQRRVFCVWFDDWLCLVS